MIRESRILVRRTGVFGAYQQSLSGLIGHVLLSWQIRGERAQWVLHLNSFLMITGFFMLIPLVGVHYTRDLGMTATVVGLVLGLRMLIQQGLSMFGGALADRTGYKTPLVVGLLVRSAGFGVFAFAETIPTLFLAATIVALGGALFDSTSKAALASLVPAQKRARSFSLNSLAGNVGLSLGPFIGALLLEVDFRLLCLASAGVYLLATLQTWTFLHPIPPASSSTSFASGLSRVWLDRRFVAFTAIIAGFHFVNMQLYVTLPLHVERIFDTPRPLSVLYAMNSGLALVLQYPLIQYTSRRFAPATVMSVGVAVLALGMGLVPLAQGLLPLVGCVGLYALGRVLVEPTLQAYVSQLAPASNLGSYFGFSSLAIAVGGGLSNYAGGALFDLSVGTQQPALPWVVIASVGVVVSLLLAAFGGWQARRREVACAAAGSASG